MQRNIQKYKKHKGVEKTLFSYKRNVYLFISIPSSVASKLGTGSWFKIVKNPHLFRQQLCSMTFDHSNPKLDCEIEYAAPYAEVHVPSALKLGVDELRKSRSRYR